MILPGTYQNGFAPRDGEPLYPELQVGCVGAWSPCLGPTGLVLRDWSGRQNHCTLTNMNPGTDWTPSSGRWALDFDGADGYALSSVNVPITGASPRSVSVWVNLHSLDNNAIIGWGPATANNWFYLQVITGNWYVSGFSNDFPTGVAATTGPKHVSVVYDGVTVTVYVDGKSIGSNAKTFATTAGPLHLATRGLLDVFADCQIHEAIVHNRALPLQQIRLLASRRGIAHELAPIRYAGSAGFLAAWRRQQSFIIGGGLQ